MAPLIPRIQSAEVGLKPLAYLIRPDWIFGGIESAVTPALAVVVNSSKFFTLVIKEVISIMIIAIPCVSDPLNT